MISPVPGVQGFRPLAMAIPAIALATFAGAADLIDINHATAAELKAHRGIRDACAAIIIRHRPYNKTQLRTFLPYATYKQIRPKIIAKQDGK